MHVEGDKNCTPLHCCSLASFAEREFEVKKKMVGSGFLLEGQDQGISQKLAFHILHF